MVEYGVNVANKFGFLSDDEVEDPDVILKRAEAASKKEERTPSQKKAEKHAAAERKKKAAAAAALSAAQREQEAKKTAALGSGRRDAADKENRPSGERGRGRGRGRGGWRRRDGDPRMNAGNEADQRLNADRGNEGVERGPNEPRGGYGRGRVFRAGGRTFRGGRGGGINFNAIQPTEGDNERPVVNGTQIGDSERVSEFTGGRGGFRSQRGRGGYDGERWYRGRGGRGRMFDRLSGSDRIGVKPMEKKDGYGKGNWGTEQDDLTGATENIEAVVNEGVKSEEVMPPREKTEEELRAEAEAEELMKQKTLDEFKAEMEKRERPHFNLRKAGEGTNDKEFAKLVPLRKEGIVEAPEEEVVVVRREPRAKRLDIEYYFTDEVRGGRGGRIRDGGYRGRGGRGNREGRGPRVNQGAFEVSPDAFPALGAQ
ncbi:hypothetical protein AB6A40_007220 [Gnathostoma spinigerum]|uniref:Hyaluronan/mRNA-binding protein domain-containing protein n=1 Tax=Gnathostoma spinigerum TaxID=75299 RepID=A0ABD6EL58_9BILA